MTKHTRRDPGQYLDLLARREAERLTFAQLFEESGVPIATLQYWARKLREPKQQADAAAADDSSRFIEVDIGAVATSTIEVVLDGDLRIRHQTRFRSRDAPRSNQRTRRLRSSSCMPTTRSSSPRH